MFGFSCVHSAPAKLVIHEQVTFTNKAALEMKKRLNVLLGEVAGSKLVLGQSTHKERGEPSLTSA